MAKRYGASGAVFLAVICGLITSFAFYRYLDKLRKEHKENWQDVVVAEQDIEARTKIGPEMVKVTQLPPGHIAANTFKNRKDVEGKIAISRIKTMDQVRQSDLAKEGQMPGLSYDIPPGKRAIAIGVDEIKGVGATIKPGDHVDLLVTFHDPVARQDTTQMFLQYVPVLAVDKGKTDTASGEGAVSSITLAVNPDETELVTAADRAGVIRVSLRPAQDKTIVASTGMRVSEILRGKYFEPATHAVTEATATPIIISPPPSPREKPGIRAIRGTSEQIIPNE